MKIAIITGGSRGIGKSAAINSAKRGIGVIITYNSHPKEAAAFVSEIEQNGGKAVALKLDITKIKTFEEFSAQVSKHLEREWQQSTSDDSRWVNAQRIEASGGTC